MKAGVLINKIRALLVILGSVLAMNCGVPKEIQLSAPVVLEKIFESDYERVWTAIQDVLAEDKTIEIKAVDKESSVISYTSKLEKETANKNSLQKTAIPSAALLHVNILVLRLNGDPSDQKHRIKVLFSGKIIPRIGPLMPFSKLYSQGSVENSFFSRLDTKLKGESW
jgi:hypothetical protein